MIVAMNLAETAAQVQAYVASHHLSFPHLLDADAKVASLFSVYDMPTNYLVNREGWILGGDIGDRDWNSPEAHALIESLLKEDASHKTQQK